MRPTKVTKIKMNKFSGLELASLPVPARIGQKLIECLLNGAIHCVMAVNCLGQILHFQNAIKFTLQTVQSRQ